MKWMLKMIVVSLALCTCARSQVLAGTIIVNLEGINTSKGGEVYTAIFTKQNFLKFGEQLFGKVTPVSGNHLQIVFENVPAGSYGIASFQHTDGSELLSKNFLGIPKEPLGFSRNPRIRFGPPDFEEVKITIGSTETVRISINMK